MFGGWLGFGVITGATLLLLAVLQTLAYIVGRRIGRYNVVDVVWGLGFIGVAWLAVALGDGDRTRGLILAAVITVWGARLSWHMVVKSRGKGEDPRYEDLLAEAGGDRPAIVIRKVFGVQGAAQWFVSLPIQVSALLGPTTGWAWLAFGAGAALAAIGLIFEAVGDAQLRSFKANPDNRGRIMDRGLWAWTRHPNYFGDATLWWGLWLICASVWPVVLTVLSPVAMTYFLVYATGARRAERYMAPRPGYAEYQQRTSFFVPLPPSSQRSRPGGR